MGMGATSLLDKEFNNSADADLFLVAEGFEPSSELVRALNIPRHPPIMP